MGFWSFKKDPKKERRRAMMKRAGRHYLPTLSKLLLEYRKLSRKERKEFKEICENIRFYVKVGAPDYYEDFDLPSISKDTPEYDKLKSGVERETGLVEEYLSKHPEVPEKLRILILKFNKLGSSALDVVARE
jgi:hypothetical protein